MDRNLQEIVCLLYNTFGLVSNGRTKSEGVYLERRNGMTIMWPGQLAWDLLESERLGTKLGLQQRGFHFYPNKRGELNCRSSRVLSARKYLTATNKWLKLLPTQLLATVDP